jgi:uncharacterized protein (TIGR03435 family)
MREPDIARLLKEPLPSKEQVELACERVLQRLRFDTVSEQNIQNDDVFSTPPGFHWVRLVAGAMAGILLVLISVTVFRNARSGTNIPAGSIQEPAYLSTLKRALGLTRQERQVPPPSVFEVISVRPGDPNGGGGRGAGALSCGGDIQVEPHRFIATNVTLYRLIALTYGKDCIFLEQNADLLFGGPEWIRSASFVIQALMPEGSPIYTRAQLDLGTAPQLQDMIRNLLVSRFKLILHTDMKEMQVYFLMPARGTRKLTPWKEGDRSGGFVGNAGRGDDRSFHIIGGKKSMADLAIQLEDATGRTVVDRTGITGEFNYDIRCAPLNNPIGAESLSEPSLFTALQEQLGLKLEASRAPVQVLVIDRAERPTDN